ncbi:MAG: alpha-amylase [Flavobacteriales bacterium]|nr:alpha-amylase [Flavobacteriales bacterium]|tara:strand:- start:10981 stop:12252 length:1272 start_codon:yes stop_codon:yes gene_type:complete
MKKLCFYFQVHQPFRLKNYRFFDISVDNQYFDEKKNHDIMRKVAHKCYLPMNQLLLEQIQAHNGNFKVAFSISGVCIEQFELYAQDVLESFKRLADTGCVEFIAETYGHSLSALKSPEEFKKQVAKQTAKIEQHFGQTPKTFRNTELIYNNYIGSIVQDMGYKTMITEGADHVMGWRSPNFLYSHCQHPDLKLLLKNYKLSDDIAFRFSERSWESWPLKSETFAHWVDSIPWNEEIVNLFMDYETFGEHQWEDSGIFDFMRELPNQIINHSQFDFVTPSEAAKELKPISGIDIHSTISWADAERDLTAWLGNPMQDDAFDSIYALEYLVNKIDDDKIKDDWVKLQTSDHFYYMCTKFWSDGDVHKYFSHYDSPYEAFLNYMNVLTDFEERVRNAAGVDEEYREVHPGILENFKKFLPEGVELN